ncbi:MAG: two-component regulator propeller domain-containing protein [Ferruginibacter sp.]
MRYGLFTILVFLFAGLIKPLSAQQLIFKNYTVNDGLIANSVRRIFQDSKGFLWIATWEGLSKYDGHRFTNYSIANGLSHNLINDLYESPDGRLYVATNDKSIDIIHENKIIPKAVLTGITVNRFFHLPGNKLLATTDNNGLQEFNEGKFIKLHQDLLLPSFFDLCFLNDSVFMAVGERGIQLMNRKYELLSEIRDNDPIYTDFKIYVDSKKRILIGTPTGMMMMPVIPGKGQPIKLTLPAAPFNIPVLRQQKINDIFEDANGITWIATSSGLVKIGADGSYQLITKKEGLASDIVTSIFQDREKNIWFGTSLGLSKLITRSGIFMYTTENGMWSNILSFIQPVGKGHLLVSTQKGAQVFNTANGKFDAVINIIDPPFFSVVENSQPTLVIAVNKMGVFDTNSLQFTKTLSYPFPLPPTNIVCDRQGNFFASDQTQLYFISRENDQPVKILEDNIRALHVDKNETLWAGTFGNGLYHIRYDLDNKKLRILSNEHFLAGESIRSLFEDPKGNIWAGTRYHGIYRFSKDQAGTYTISNIDQSKGLSSNWIKGFAEAAGGDLWVATWQGLDKLIKHDSSYRVFNFSRANNYYGSITGMVTGEDHSLWLATGEGMVHITDGRMEQLSPLPVYITKISAPDSVYALNEEKLRLDFRHNQLEFEFSSPGFINEQQLLYSYRLLGSARPEWSAPINQYNVSYASLQPGKYRFEVRTMGWNGNWGKPAGFEFKIYPPWWQTGWFLMACSILCFTGIYWTVRKRVRAIRNKASMKQQIAETEMMALRVQMNPHFMFNCINSIDSFIHNNDKYNATHYLNKFARLLRNILDSSKKNTVSFAKDIETLKLYIELEELRNNYKFKTTFSIDEELLNNDHKVPPLIIQPFVENAILHGLKNKDGSNGSLEIGIKKIADTIEYSIRDNGIGRKAAAQIAQNKESSFGMQLSFDRIKLFNEEQEASVEIIDLEDNGIPAGTLIKATLKIS